MVKKRNQCTHNEPNQATKENRTHKSKGENAANFPGVAREMAASAGSAASATRLQDKHTRMDNRASEFTLEILTVTGVIKQNVEKLS